MGASSLILALSALWTGPSWGQDRSGVGSILPGRVSSLEGGFLFLAEATQDSQNTSPEGFSLSLSRSPERLCDRERRCERPLDVLRVHGQDAQAELAAASTLEAAAADWAD